MRATIIINIDERTGKIDYPTTLCEVSQQITIGRNDVLDSMIRESVRNHYAAMLDDLQGTIQKYVTLDANQASVSNSPA
ncbi:hypothetical protein [Millionella massiliensis]|uniref:hypothetical protein n=1 Tax=Millionella massiliensis TaxID=1871023 RepID=UPI0023A79D7D|nr:hypothetical protein [Millionella massiliensis]